ncbi:MAG: dihydroorotate dehydrogenase electron transfer subunit, partial [Bacteroidaceae bacterium]
MKKYIMDWTVCRNDKLDERHILLKLKPTNGIVPAMKPGQFVQLKSPASNDTFLRLPISINYVDNNQLWLMIQTIGEGTKALTPLREGDTISLVLPLGNGFSIDKAKGKVLLVGGGVGVAPLLWTGKILADNGTEPTFLLGGRNADGILWS